MRISELRNLGPSSEKDFMAAGVTSAEALLTMTVEEAFIQAMVGRLSRGLTIKGVSANYLYSLYGAIHDLPWQDIPPGKKREMQEFLQEIRDSEEFGS
jgi:DNA transformation protein